MTTRTVHLFVFDSLSDWEAAFAIAGINNPAFQKEPGRHRVQTVGISREPVTTIGGLRVLPDVALDDVAPRQSAMLILPGGVAWDEHKNGEAVEKARDFLSANVPVAAICGATAGLARAGLLDHRPHTSNAREYLDATRYAGAAFYRDVPAITDGNLITAAATAPIEFAYEIFKLLDLYAAETLEAWRGLYSTGDSRYFQQLVRSASKPAASPAARH
jgi:putative intracellular protease/amidase